MKIFIKGLNSCAMRKQKLSQYENYFTSNDHEIVSSPGNADYILIWSCAFRADVRDNSISETKRYANEFSGKIILAGCLPKIEPETVKSMSPDYVIPWHDDTILDSIFSTAKPLENFAVSFGEGAVCIDAAKFRKDNPQKDVTFHDQFIKLVVSEGCHFDCAYCSEKLAFPTYRSFPLDQLKSICADMVRSTGRHEVILLADSLGNYGEDIGSSLPELITTLSQIDDKLRFALNNLNPASVIAYWTEITGFIERGIIQHINLPIQSASDKVLKLMNRAYSKAELEKIFVYLNETGFSEFDTHIIAGFPGETETDFDETIDFILRFKPKYVLGSAFMESPGMPAAKLPDKVDIQSTRKRLIKFAEQMAIAGIIANTDESELSAERFRRLNRLEE